MGGFETGTPVPAEPPLEYHPRRVGGLTPGREPAGGPCLAGSLTGAVASQNVTEARVRSAQDGRQPSAERKSTSGLDCEAHKPSRWETRF